MIQNQPERVNHEAESNFRLAENLSRQRGVDDLIEMEKMYERRGKEGMVDEIWEEIESLEAASREAEKWLIWSGHHANLMSCAWRHRWPAFLLT